MCALCTVAELLAPADSAAVTKHNTPNPFKHTTADKDPVLQKLCGCTPDFAVEGSSMTWQDAVTSQYPDLQPTAYFANILAMCNPQAELTPESTPNAKVLVGGQVLVGLCTTIGGQSYHQFMAKAQADLVDAKNKLKDKYAKPVTPPAENVAADLAAVPDATAVASAAAVFGAETVAVAADTSTCTINTATSTANVRPVVLANSCPVYHNGCSGPSDTLSYQAQLTPCCQAHDW